MMIIITIIKAKRSLTPEEAQLVNKVEELANIIVQVDVFDKIGAEKKEVSSSSSSTS